MTEINRRDVLKRIGGAVPAMALAETVLFGDFEAHGQEEVPEQLLNNFVKLSVVLTGHSASELDPRLAREYVHRIGVHMKQVKREGALGALLKQFAALGTPNGPITPDQDNLIKKIMSDAGNQCMASPPAPLGQVKNPNNSEALALINESHDLINQWTKSNPFECETVAEVVNVNPCDPPDWGQTDINAFLCQEITAIWYMSAIYKVAVGMINVGSDGTITPAFSFHYGSARGYVSGLVWDTVGGHTHPYAQCGGEFGYWEKNPEPEPA